MSDLESLRKKITEEEARLARVEKERDEVLARLKYLRDRLIGDLPVSISPKPIPSDSLHFPPKNPLSGVETKPNSSPPHLWKKKDDFP